jgi:hypothetical protein
MRENYIQYMTTYHILLVRHILDIFMYFLLTVSNYSLEGIFCTYMHVSRMYVDNITS